MSNGEEEVVANEEPRDPVDSLLPRWVEFSRLGNAKEIQHAATQFFSDEKASVKSFQAQFGVDLHKFQGYYLETGMSDAPQGPFIPTRITPILVLRQSRSGQSFTPHIFKHNGLLHDNRLTAWIEREEWDAHVQDTFAEELKQKAAKARAEAQKRAAEQTDTEEAHGEK